MTLETAEVEEEPASTHARDLEIAIELARKAGAVALEHYGTAERLTKTHAMTIDEPVTAADRAAQRIIIAGLREQFPNDGIIGEESETGESITADNLQPTGRNWVIDPIDGTNNFIAGMGNWAVCIGLLDKGMPVAGVVYDVSRDRLFAGGLGLGARVNDRPTKLIAGGMSNASIIMVTSNLLDDAGRAPQWAFRLLDQTHWKVRMLGSAALESALVGAGIAQAAVTVNGKLWDCVAPAAFTIAAGGIVTMLDGSPLFPFNVKGYRGAKVPFLTTTPAAKAQMITHLYG